MTQTTTKQRKQRAATTTAATTVPEKKLSLMEFRAWLSGVEEMQPDDWTPDFTQWRRIRAKIDQIVETHRSATHDDDFVMPPPPRMIPAGPSLLTPAAVAPMPSSPPPFLATGDMAIKGQGGVSGSRIKTPDIDTSGANGYVSGLE